MSAVSPIPAGFHSLTPYLVIEGCDRALEFYARAFGAVELTRMNLPGTDRVMHAEVRIGDTPLMMTEAMPEQGSFAPGDTPSPVAVHLYCEDVDAAVKRASEAGCEVLWPPTTMFWGDRFAKLKDPFGHQWSVATHVEDVAPEECERRAQEFFGGGGAC